MDRIQAVLLGLPILLFCTDLVNLFTPPPPRPSQSQAHHHHIHHHEPQSPSPPPITPETLVFPPKTSDGVGSIGVGNTVVINFCSSCSYRGTAVTMKTMLETAFPGVDIVLANHPPSLPKRLLGKLVPVVQVGVIGIVMAGEQIFPMLGFVAPPPWYYSLRANRFGTMATTWLLGNVVQNFLQSTGAFEVSLNGELIFSKLKGGRFPGEIELKDLIGRRIAASRMADGLGDLWGRS